MDGPAFAAVDFNGSVYQPGISKRFYAACKAMEGLIIAHPNWPPSRIVEESYKIADEMKKKDNQ